MIVTRGFGQNSLIITRGYGWSKLVEFFGEIVTLLSRITKEVLLKSDIGGK